MFKKIHVVVAVSALLLTACGQSTATSTESASPAAAAASFPVTIENNGTSVTITEQPDAIISLSPTATEI